MLIKLSKFPIGYTRGNVGVNVQLIYRYTTVALDELTGNVTLNAESIIIGTVVSFTFNNNQIAVEDIIYLQHKSS